MLKNSCYVRKGTRLQGICHMTIVNIMDLI